MTVLTLMPCQDKEDYASSKAEVSSVQKQSKGIEHNDQEICPPFCTCSCCSVSRDFIQAKSYEIVVYKVQTRYSEYKTPAIAEQFIEIYQPPQIA
jgi:hypothetical protein